MATWGPEAGKSKDRQIEISNSKLNSFRAAHVYTIIAELRTLTSSVESTTYGYPRAKKAGP